MNIPYNSIYDEAISDRVLQKVGKSKFKNLGNAPSSKLNDFESQIVEELENDIINLSTSLLKLLKLSRKEFKNLEKSSLKLKLKDRSYFKPFKQSLFADGISSSYGTVSDVSFPGKFGKIIDEIRLKCNELQDIFDGSDYKTYYNHLPKNLQNSKEIWKSLNLDNTSSFNYGNIRNWIKLGITPANSNGFYRLHATNAPPDAFKSSTGGIGIGKYMYLAVIHNCGHGFTDGSSDDALKVWNHVVKKRNDVYSFMAEDELGKDLVLAISVLLPKKSVLQLLNKWIFLKNYNNKLSKEYASFFGWLKYRNENFGDLPIDLLDDGLYELFKKEIDKLNFSAPVVQNTNVSSNKYTPTDTSTSANALKTVDISNLEWKKEESQKMSWYDIVSNTPLGYRLPTIQELNTAIQNNDEGFESNEYWSSTTHVESNNFAYYVLNGKVYKGGKSAAKLVRYVKEVSNRNTLGYIPRSDPSDTANALSSLEIIDVSNLEWKNEERYEKSWYQAVDDTPDGYRLPTIQELHSSIKSGITGFRRDDYWSSTTYFADNSYGYYVYNNPSEIDVDISDKRAYPKKVRYVKEVSSRNTQTSNTNFVNTAREAKQIVDISNIEWQNGERPMTYDRAITQIPNGYRLPTVQELYTAYKQNIEGFSRNEFISSNKDEDGFIWFVNFLNGNTDTITSNTTSLVKYVKEVSGRNTTTTSNTNTRILNRDQARQIVDVSNLLTSVIQNKEYTWDQAKDLERKGWRLPTIQELYSISEQRVSLNLNLNNLLYWSSSERDNDIAWGISIFPGYTNLGHAEKYRKGKIILVKRR